MTIQYIIMQMCYWALFCSIYSFANSFLSELSLTPSIIGSVIALASIFSVITQPIISKFIDKYNKITLKKVLSVSAIGILITLLFITFSKNLYIIIPMFIFLLIFLLNAQTFMYPFIFEYINAGYKVNFGISRGLGSLSFSLTASLLGNFVVQYGVFVVPKVAMALTIGLIASMFLFKPITVQEKKEATNISFKEFYNTYPKFVKILVGITLLFFTHNVLFTFLKDILELMNYTSQEVGYGYTIASFVELPVMGLIPILSKKFKFTTLFKVSAIGFTVKAFITFMAFCNSSLILLYFAQSLQMFGFALYIPVVLYYSNGLLKEKDLIKGQMYLGVALTFGGIIGNFFGGQIYELTSINTMLIVSVLVSLIGTILIVKNIEKIGENNE